MEDWMMSLENCWARLDKKTGSFNTNLNIFFDDNDTENSRSVKVRVKSKDGLIKSEFTLVQKSKSESIIYHNDRQVKSFTKKNCNPSIERGETLDYVVEAGKHSSTISKEDANAKALIDIELNGQEWVNKNGSCTTVLWYNDLRKKDFTKNNCDSDTEVGSIVTATIQAGSFSSIISQADANTKADAELNATGQAYANSHGTCSTVKWYNTEKKKTFQKTDCLVTEVGSFVEYVIPSKRFTSSISQSDADNKAISALNSEGPDYANEHGTCSTTIWYNIEKSKSFTKNNCSIGFIGDSYLYVVQAGKYSSTISQADADTKADNDINTNGQSQANLNAECLPDPNYFIGVYSEEFTKNDCEEGSFGSKVIVNERSVTGSPFTSTVSQADANSKAEAAVKTQGQALANSSGMCTELPVFTGVASKEFTKNDCTGSSIGSKRTITQNDVTGGPFTSTVSQADANSKAMSAVNSQGQALANSSGTCTWKGVASKDFQKNDCEEGQVGSTVTVDQDDLTGGPFTSIISQADADSKAMIAVQAQGQSIANTIGNCENQTTYTGKYSKDFIPVCESCHTGVSITVTQNQVGGPFTSTISQADADEKARSAVESGGQAYANKNGVCNPDSTDPVWEDVVPEVLQCDAGKSQKQQKDTNSCSNTFDTTRWIDGGNKICSWTGVYSETFQRNNCEIADSGTEVLVKQSDVTSGPFTSTVSQADANSKAEAAVKAQGQSVANSKGLCQFVGVYSKSFVKNNCGSCQHGIAIDVNQDSVGGPFYSLESQAAANALAQAAVEESGQAYANKNGSCEIDNTDPVWVDSDPLETRCTEGISEKKQINTNACYGGVGERWILGGDKVCVWTGSYSWDFIRNNCGTGSGSIITVDQDDVTGGPFTSTVSQADANSKAETAVKDQGQALANSTGTCTYLGKASKSFQRNNCTSCHTGSTIIVNQDQVGGPFTSIISQADADSKALAAVNSGGQAAANKNGDCLADSTTPSWTDTGSTQCSGCSSQKQQKDTNSCSSSYNTTKWVAGGGKDCSGNGSWSDTGEPWCSGTTKMISQVNSCGSQSGSRVLEHNSTFCGWTPPCDPSYNPTSDYRCYNGKSQRKYYSDCYGDRWTDEGAACTATNNTQYCKSGCACATCVAAGTVSGSGSTTANAQSDANTKAQNQANAMTCRTQYLNKAITLTKTRNNCGAGCTGGSYQSTYGAGQNSSCVSQSDVDAIAAASANAWCQSQANTHGTCNCPPAKATINLNIDMITSCGSQIAVLFAKIEGPTNYTGVDIGDYQVDPGSYTFSGAYRCGGTGSSHGLIPSQYTATVKAGDRIEITFSE